MISSLSSLSVCTSVNRLLAIQLDHFARLAGARSDEGGAAGKHVDLAGELTGSMDSDERLAGAGWPDNLDPTRRDDKERHDPRSRLDEHLSRPDRTQLSMRGDPFDLSRRQDRKHALGARGKRQWNRQSCIGHGRCTLSICIIPLTHPLASQLDAENSSSSFPEASRFQWRDEAIRRCASRRCRGR